MKSPLLWTDDSGTKSDQRHGTLATQPTWVTNLVDKLCHKTVSVLHKCDNINGPDVRKEKKFNVLWEDVSGHVSPSQWKGRGIDGRLDPGLGPVKRIVLAHCAGTRPGYAWWGMLLLLVLLDLALGVGR